MLGYVVGVSLNKGVLYSVSWREKHFIALSILLLHSHGAGNNELESYTPSNAYVVWGKLIIEAQKNTNSSIATYSSSKIVSRGKADFGVAEAYVDDEDEEAESSEALKRSRRFEAKLKLPWGRGIWPAFWMLPSFDVYGGWPKVGPLFHARSSP